MSSTINLLPYPFCNNAEIAINNENPKDNSGGYFIECPGCGASTSLRFACGDDPTSLLAEQWNRRATSHCLHQIQEPATAEQAAWHAGLDEGRAQAAPAAVAVPDVIAAFEKLLEASMAALTDRSSAKEHEQIWDDAHDALEAWKARAALAATPVAARDADGEAFRTAARLGLTLRFYGNCAQSGIPGTPNAYEVTHGQDRAAAMREAIQRADAAIASQAAQQGGAAC